MSNHRASLAHPNRVFRKTSGPPTIGCGCPRSEFIHRASFSLLFVASGVSLEGVGIIKAVYPVIWGIGQVITGPLADRIGRKPLIVWGMITQAPGHLVIGLGLAAPFLAGLIGSVLLGIGTAMVYPALLAAVGNAAHPVSRASTMGVYRWPVFSRSCRDLSRGNG